MMLGEIISAVQFSGGPVEVELFLINAIFEPMVSHVESFGFFHAHGGVENTMCCRIVSLKRSASRRLFVPHFFEGGDHGDGFLGVEKETTGFGFRGRGSNRPNGFAKDVNGAIGGWSRRGTGGTRKSGQEKMTGSTAASVGKDKVCGIGADGKDHVAGMITDGGDGMCGKVVKEHVTGLSSVFRWGSLTVGDLVQGDNDRGVTAARIVEEQAGNLLDALDTEFVKEGRDVSVGKLDFLAVHRGSPEMGRMLWSSRGRVTQREEGFGYIAGH